MLRLADATRDLLIDTGPSGTTTACKMTLRELIDHLGGCNAISHRFSTFSEAASIKGAAVALVGEDSCYTIAFGDDWEAAPFRATTRVDVGCVVKPFVSALVGRLMCSNLVRLDDEIGSHLASGSACRDASLDRTRVRELLDHTDGIGYRKLDSIPTTATGYVDREELLSVICSEHRAFEPGQYCADGHCGFGLLGALVEKHAGEQLVHVLRTELLDRLLHNTDEFEAADGRRPSLQARVCPAKGRGLALSAGELGQFLRLHLRPTDFDVPSFGSGDYLSMLSGHRVAYPGWSAGTTGCTLGWKTFDCGWIGHNGVGEDRSVVLVRLHPMRRIGAVFTCLGGVFNAYALMGKLLGGTFPELKLPLWPRMLTDKETHDRPVTQYLGAFGNDTRRTVISSGSLNKLYITITEDLQGQRRVVGESELVPAIEDLFVLVKPSQNGLRFVQYPWSEGPRRFNVLWDGENLWRRHSDFRR